MKKNIIITAFMIMLLVCMGGVALAEPWGYTYPDFSVEIIDAPKQVNAGAEFEVTVLIENLEDEKATKFIEVGLYDQNTVNEWYISNPYYSPVFSPFGGAEKWQNCVPEETNVQTTKLTLGTKGGFSIVFTKLITAGIVNKVLDSKAVEYTFTLKAPESAVQGEDYGIHVAAYNVCYNALDNPEFDGTGQSDQDVEGIQVIPLENPIPQTCTDNLKNQDETSVDCGGVCTNEGKFCNDWYNCKVDNDCLSDNCVNNYCHPFKEPLVEICNDNKDNDKDGKTDCNDEDCFGVDECKDIVPPISEICNDGKDNDEDSKVDCDDEDCKSFEICGGTVPITGEAIEIISFNSDNAELAVNEPLTITAEFKVGTAGKYLLEAGSGRVGDFAGLTILDTINDNECKPEDLWFANRFVDLEVGTHTVDFVIYPSTEGKGEGIYNYWVAVVEGCDKDPLKDSEGNAIQAEAKQVKVGSLPNPEPTDTAGKPWWILIVVAIIAALVLFMPRKKKGGAKK